MTREELKMMFLQMDCSNIPVRKEIIVDLRYIKNEIWPGYGYVEIVNDGPDGYSSFSTHEENNNISINNNYIQQLLYNTTINNE